MSLLELLRRAIGAPDPPRYGEPSPARIRIYSTEPVKRSTESRSPRARD